MTARTHVDDAGRVCTRCKEYKLWTEFYSYPGGHNGHSSQCIQCHSDLCECGNKKSKDAQVCRKCYSQLKSESSQKPDVQKHASFADGCVYVLGIAHPNFSRYFKIGRTMEDTLARLKSLQSGCPWPLYVVAEYHDVSGYLESKLHKRFARYRTQGEWFHFERKNDNIYNGPYLISKAVEKIRKEEGSEHTWV